VQANELFDRPNTILLDGGMGTMLQAAGLKLGARPEELNITDPALIESIHARYAAAGSRIINANTFGASAHKLAGSAYRRSLQRVLPTANGPVPLTVHWPRWMWGRWGSCWNPTAPLRLRMPWQSMAASSGRAWPPGLTSCSLRPLPICMS